MMRVALLSLALAAAAPALAQQPACTTHPAVPGFAGWGKPAGDTLAIGKQATLALKPATVVRFVPALARAPKAGTYGNYVVLTVPAAGTYRIALSDKAWIDAVHQGKRLRSVAHEHGPDCSGIAKIVAFQLEAGRNYLQLSEVTKPTIGVMVVKG